MTSPAASPADNAFLSAEPSNGSFRGSAPMPGGSAASLSRPGSGRVGILQRLRPGLGKRGGDSDLVSDATVPLLSNDSQHESQLEGNLRSAPDQPIHRSGTSFTMRQQVAVRAHDALTNRSSSAESLQHHNDKLEVGFYELANPDLQEPTDPDAQGSPFSLVPTSYGKSSSISRTELLQFVIGVIWPFKWMLLLAYVLLLAGVCFRVMTLKYEGDALNALQEGGTSISSSTSPWVTARCSSDPLTSPSSPLSPARSRLRWRSHCSPSRHCPSSRSPPYSDLLPQLLLSWR
mmetsp:Transcript_28231/g.72558  ORF Transcript_28231/g.72558 Transcript_28231/m.72558 type:complete len:290 (+) Transcript_28231:1200-2069(+)